jgi:hypothetical protein
MSETTIAAHCPFCDWTTHTAATLQDQPLITSYVAKALMDHLRRAHARHDEAKVDEVGISTLLSSRTKMGRVEFSLNDAMTQWDLDKARQIHRMLGEAIEAAVSDTLLYQFLVERIGLEDQHAARALLDFRALRQGSTESVNPS